MNIDADKAPRLAPGSVPGWGIIVSGGLRPSCPQVVEEHEHIVIVDFEVGLIMIKGKWPVVNVILDCVHVECCGGVGTRKQVGPGRCGDRN